MIDRTPNHMAAERKGILSVRSRSLIGNLGGKIEDAVVRAVIQDDNGIKLQVDVVGPRPDGVD